MSEINFQVFGSQDSVDVNVIVFLDSLPNKDESKKLCDFYKLAIKRTYFNILSYKLDRVIDINLGVLKKGILIDVFKGSVDEINNSLFYTYNYHKNLQLYIQQIDKPIKRDIHNKMLRSSRIILSLLSRTNYNILVKEVLKTNLKAQVNLIQKIDLSKIQDFGIKNQTNKDVLKTITFQMCQTIALSSGFDIYSKSSISVMFPTVKKFIYRSDNINKYDLLHLEELKCKYIDILHEEFSTIGEENEKTYSFKKNVA